MQASPAKNSAFKWLWAVAELRASMREKALLYPLALHADSNGQSYPGEATLLRESGIGSESTLRRTLRQLERRGWIKTTRHGHAVKINGKTFFLNRYSLTVPIPPPVTAMTGSEAVTTGQNEHDHRSNSNSPPVKTSMTTGHSYDRETARGTSRLGTSSITKGGSVTRKGEFVSDCKPRIIQ
jgi:hypothetical protein